MCLSCAFGRLVGYASEQSLPMHLQTNAAAWRSPVDRFMHSPDVSEAKIDTDAPHCPQQPRPVRPCMSVSDGCCVCGDGISGVQASPAARYTPRMKLHHVMPMPHVTLGVEQAGRACELVRS